MQYCKTIAELVFLPEKSEIVKRLFGGGCFF
jgi:hypothetical protein